MFQYWTCREWVYQYGIVVITTTKHIDLFVNFWIIDYIFVLCPITIIISIVWPLSGIHSDTIRSQNLVKLNDIRAQPSQWRRNERHGVSSHRRLQCLPNCWFRGRSKKTSKLGVTGLREDNSPVTGEFPHKGSVTRKMFPFADIIMEITIVNLVQVNGFL